MRVGIDFVNKLEIVAHAYLGGFCFSQQAVIISFASAHSVAAAVISYGGNYHKLDIVNIFNVVAGGFLDVESAILEFAAVVGEHLKVHAVHAWKEEMLAVMPFFDELQCGELVGK